MSSFLDGPIAVAYHIVTWLSQILPPLTGGLATAAAIIAFTIAVRLLLSPLSFLGLRGQTRIAAMQPRIAQLRAQYAKQPEKLQTELSSLYAAEAGGMMAGCLPLLLQLPFFSVMYRLFLSGTVSGKPNELLHRTLFGTPLGSHWLSGAGPVSGQGLVFLGLFALLAVIAALSARAARTDQASPAGLTTAITRLLPFTTLIIAAFVPLAAGLYLLTSTAWTLTERMVLRRRIAAPASGSVVVPMAGSARSGPDRGRAGAAG